MPRKKQVSRFTIAWWNLYLDIYTMYHTAFFTWLLKNVEDANTNMVGNCNDGITSFSLKGYYGKFHMWVNKNWMAKLLSILCLEEEGYHIEYARNKDWVVKTPQGVVILFKIYTCLNKGVPYIYMREWKEGFGMIQTFRNNFDNFTSKDI